MYSVDYQAEHVERHSRLTTFFRSIMQIPAALLTFVYVFAASVVSIIAWFAIVFTARYPQGMYDFVVGALRNQTRLSAYGNLVTDQYPPWDGQPHAEYPVQVTFGPPLERYSRLKTFFRFILIFPLIFVSFAFQLILAIGALCAWFVILFTGKMPRGLQDMIDMSLRYITRYNAYSFYLTETWPPLNDPKSPVETSTGAYAPPTPPPAPPAL